MGGDNLSNQEAALPDIKGSFRLVNHTQYVQVDGALKFDYNGTSESMTGVRDDVGFGRYSPVKWSFSAANYNEIYGKSDKVLPESFALVAQIKY